MSANQKPPDFDEEFTGAIDQWRKQHQIQEADAIMLLLELFRIHQKHWDELRHRQMPSLDQFRQDIAATVEAAKSLKEQTARVLKALNVHPAATKTIPVDDGDHGSLGRNTCRNLYWKGSMKIDFFPFHFSHLPALSKPWRCFLLGYAVLLIIIVIRLLLTPYKRNNPVAQLGGLIWKRNQFCRGWLITGDTGSGKTSSGINQLAHQVFQHEPDWGGLCIDEKGVYWETLSAMAHHYERETDLIHLQIRPDDTEADWQPPHRFNLTGDRSIPFSTYAKYVVDTATSLGQAGDKGFFKNQAQTHIAHALELLAELQQPVTLRGAYEVLSNKERLEEELKNLNDLSVETPQRHELKTHFVQRFLGQPAEQLGGVRETIGNYLQYFLAPEVAEVFCAGKSTFQFSAIDEGKIILVTMPQKFQTERRYVNTFLKLLFYNHALRRFDKSKAQRAGDNLLILWADEAQRFMTASEDGTSDYNCVDVIREAGTTIVAAAQSTTSLIPPLGNDKSKVLTLNLRNRMIFRSADEADAVQSADFLGKKLVVKRSWGSSAGKRSVNYSETEEHKIKSYKLRKLRDHECVLVHCENGFCQVTLPPLEPDGTVARWFPLWRKLF